MDIFFLQETHISSTKEAKLLGEEWGGKCFWSFGSTRSCGDAILFHKRLLVEVHNFHLDNSGRYVIVNCTVNNCDVKFINIYAPNVSSERINFFKNLDYYFQGSENIIFAGDFNCVEELRDKVQRK